MTCMHACTVHELQSVLNICTILPKASHLSHHTPQWAGLSLNMCHSQTKGEWLQTVLPYAQPLWHQGEFRNQICEGDCPNSLTWTFAGLSTKGLLFDVTLYNLSPCWHYGAETQEHSVLSESLQTLFKFRLIPKMDSIHFLFLINLHTILTQNAKQTTNQKQVFGVFY